MSTKYKTVNGGRFKLYSADYGDGTAFISAQAIKGRDTILEHANVLRALNQMLPWWEARGYREYSRTHCGAGASAYLRKVELPC